MRVQQEECEYNNINQTFFKWSLTSPCDVFREMRRIGRIELHIEGEIIVGTLGKKKEEGMMHLTKYLKKTTTTQKQLMMCGFTFHLAADLFGEVHPSLSSGGMRVLD